MFPSLLVKQQVDYDFEGEAEVSDPNDYYDNYMFAGNPPPAAGRGAAPRRAAPPGCGQTPNHHHLLLLQLLRPPSPKIRLVI